MLRLIKTAMQGLEAKRSTLPYSEFQVEAETSVLNLVRYCGQLHLCSFTATALWLAAHRLERRGVLVALPTANVWGLAQAAKAA